MLASLMLVVVFFIVFAMRFGEGLWSNILMMMNVLLAILLALNFFEPVATMLNGMVPKGTFLWDFTALWGVFIVALLVLRICTDMISRNWVRFHPLVDQIGSYFMAAWTAWLMIGFVLITLQTGPMAREFLGFKAESGVFLGFSPDRELLALMQQSSLGPLSRSGSTTDATTFDPHGEFLPKYATRRDQVEKTTGLMAP